MAGNKVIRIGKPVPEELVLLRRFGALPLHCDQLHMVAAGMLMLSGASADTAYKLHFRDRRRKAKAQARKAGAATPKPKPRLALVSEHRL